MSSAPPPPPPLLSLHLSASASHGGFASHLTDGRRVGKSRGRKFQARGEKNVGNHGDFRKFLIYVRSTHVYLWNSFQEENETQGKKVERVRVRSIEKKKLGSSLLPSHSTVVTVRSR